jgi:peptidoglycan/LPS O-acetylase OafA/YrhL
MTSLTAIYLSGLIGSNFGAIALLLTPNNELLLKHSQALLLASIFGCFLSSVFYASTSSFEIGLEVVIGFGAFCFMAIYRYLKKPEKLLKLRPRI